MLHPVEFGGENILIILIIGGCIKLLTINYAAEILAAKIIFGCSMAPITAAKSQSRSRPSGPNPGYVIILERSFTV